MYPYPSRYTSHVQLLSLGETVGKVCGLEGDSRRIKGLTGEPAFSLAVSSLSLAGLWGGRSGMTCVRGLSSQLLVESLLPAAIGRLSQFIKSSAF